jgi:hypothetical protein
MLKGKLTDFDIISIFEMLNQQAKSGTLTIKSLSIGEISIYFLDGNIIDLSYKDVNKSLGVFLVKKQIIQKSILKKIYSRSKKEIKNITTVLVEDGYISEDLEDLIIEVYYDDTFREVLGVKEGEFSFNPENKKSDKKQFRIFYIEQILLEYVRQRDELKIIKNSIPIKNAKITKLDIIVNDLTQDEFSLYELINLEDDLDKLRSRILINYFDFINMLYSIAQKEKITITKYMNEDEKEKLLSKYIDDFDNNFLNNKLNIFMLSLSITSSIVIILLIIFNLILFAEKNKTLVKEVKVNTQSNEFFEENYLNILDANK